MTNARSLPGNPDSSGLDPERERLFVAERALLDDLRSLLDSFEASREDRGVLRQALRDLDDIFLLVVVGEFNAGKSAFINALVGSPVLEEGVTPTTTAITRLRYGDQSSSRQAGDEQVEVTHPAEFLRAVSIVDTPGTNAVIRRHEQLTVGFIPRSDLIVFLTSVDRPFTESERAFLEAIRAWGKKVVLVVNKVDILRDEAEIERVVDFVREQAKSLLGLAPEIFPVSVRLAATAKAPGHPEERQRLWEASRFGPLEQRIQGVLDDRGRVRLKLLSPLGVGERLCARYLAAAGERLAVLAEDARTVENIYAQLEVFRQDMERDFAHRLLEIENIVHEMRERGDRFFDETLRLGRVFDLINAIKSGKRVAIEEIDAAGGDV